MLTEDINTHVEHPLHPLNSWSLLSLHSSYAQHGLLEEAGKVTTLWGLTPSTVSRTRSPEASLQLLNKCIQSYNHHYDHDLEYSHHPEKLPLASTQLIIPISSPSLAPKSHWSAFWLCSWPFPQGRIDGTTIPLVVLYVWFLSLSIMLLRFVMLLHTCMYTLSHVIHTCVYMWLCTSVVHCTDLPKSVCPSYWTF